MTSIAEYWKYNSIFFSRETGSSEINVYIRRSVLYTNRGSKWLSVSKLVFLVGRKYTTNKEQLSTTSVLDVKKEMTEFLSLRRFLGQVLQAVSRSDKRPTYLLPRINP